MIQQTAEIDGKDVEIWMEIEPGSSGKHVFNYFQRNILPQYAFFGELSQYGKLVYAKTLSSKAQSGNVKLLKGLWNSDFLNEALLFPANSVHDDQVDAVSKAVCKLADRYMTDIGASYELMEQEKEVKKEYRVLFGKASLQEINESFENAVDYF